MFTQLFDLLNRKDQIEMLENSPNEQRLICYDSLRYFCRDSKQNKGTILRASVDYIKILRRQYDNSSLIDEKCQILTEQNYALQERVKVR